LGILSAIVSNELNNSYSSKLRKKNIANQNQKVSLLLIDRNLDLPMISLFHEETLFDKISNLLPNLSNASNDVQIDLRTILFDNEYQSILPGNYFHFTTLSCEQLIEQFFISKPKECVIEIYRKLCEAIPQNETKERIKPSRINAETFKNQIKNSIK
jgi:hypothetical protein